MPIYLTCRICVKSHRPAPQISTPASPGQRSISMTCGIAWPQGEAAEDIADFLCRNVDEVRAKTAELVN
jgi:hypothetical protein